MVQVDVFWSYAIGAGFASAAARQLKDEPNTFQNEYFTKTLLFLALCFAPSGVVLLWAFTGWETMYVWNRETLAAWVVLIFCVTNVTQGILGFWVAHKLIRAGKLYWANLQWVIGYMAMFFILVHGWDGTGYRRFFTFNLTEKVGWLITGNEAEVLTQSFGPLAALKWSISPVALTLLAMGVIMLPIMFGWIGKWVKEGYQLGGVDTARANATNPMKIIRTCARVIFVWVLGSIIVWSILIHLLGWGIGTLIFAAAFGFLGVGPSGVIRKDIDRITLENGVETSTAGATATTQI